MKIDEFDKKILRLVQRGDLCVPRVTKIAHILGVPVTTLQNRLKKLQETGVIKGFYGFIDGKKVGKSVTFYDVVKVVYAERYKDTKLMTDFGKRLAAVPEVQEVHTCSSDWDYLIKIKVKDVNEYAKVTEDKILPLGGIEKLEGYVVLHTMKETPIIDL